MKYTQLYLDFDGTIASKGIVTLELINALKDLKQIGVKIIIVTGRSYFSFKQVVADDFPIDFLIFSTGAGIVDWESKEIIFSKNLSQDDAKTIEKSLLETELSFMIHFPVPHNHRFAISQGKKVVSDFRRRMKIYEEHIYSRSEIDNEVAQFLAISDSNPKHYLEVKEKLSNYNVIRATSPLDNKSIWIEIFPSSISKGTSSEWLCNKFGWDQEESVGVGNDFNDIELLEWTAKSYIVNDAESELLDKYESIDIPSKNGIVFLIKKIWLE